MGLPILSTGKPVQNDSIPIYWPATSTIGGAGMSQPPKILARRSLNAQIWTGKQPSILVAVALGALLAFPPPGAAEPCRLEKLLIVDHVTDLEPGAGRSAFTIADDRIYALARLDCTGVEDGERRIVLRWTHEGRLAARKVYRAEPVANYRIYSWAPALPGIWVVSLHIEGGEELGAEIATVSLR